MENMGKNFRTPRRSDVRGWERARARFQKLKLWYLSRYDKATAWLKRQHMFKR